MKDHEIGHKRMQTALPILVVSESLISLLSYILGQAFKVDLLKMRILEQRKLHYRKMQVVNSLCTQF